MAPNTSSLCVNLTNFPNRFEPREGAPLIKVRICSLVGEMELLVDLFSAKRKVTWVKAVKLGIRVREKKKDGFRWYWHW